MYQIAYQPQARKDLFSFPEDARRVIANAIDSLSSTPRPSGAKKLAGKRQALYRLRVGRFRVIYEIKDQVLIVIIVRVAKRDEATYRNL